MATERQKGEIRHDSEIEIIGSGNIGEKARQLVEKTPLLRQIGFRTPRRIVLAEGFLDDFFRDNNLGTNLSAIEKNTELEKQIKEGNLTSEQLQVVNRVAQSFAGNPLVVRSSVEGDARGTGIYQSFFTENETGHVVTAIKGVLTSYFSEDAIAFRRDAQTGEGMGIIIEPILGQNLRYNFAPVLSGFGYTSTSRGEGYVTAVAGLGGAVNSRLGEKLTHSALERTNGILKKYLYLMGIKTMRRSSLLRNDRYYVGGKGEYTGLVYSRPTPYREGGVWRRSLELSREVKQVFDQLNLFPFFSNVEKMEKLFGKAQYFEWVMTIKKGKTVFWIVQIADVNKKLDLIDFGNFGKPLFAAHTVTGTGIKECENIVFCWNPEDVKGLYSYNKNNKGYALLYSSRLCSGGAIRNGISYRDFSNASVFLEIQDATHTGDPIDHLGGQLDVTGKLFGVLDYRDEVSPDFDGFREREKKVDGIRVYQGKVKAVASERQNQMIICRND